MILGQLIYTSFAKVGFQTLTSAEVPPEVRQVFIEQIVYQYWDSYNPPPADYRAAYLHPINGDRILFGWLYNDGADDLGRAHVPYFVCYYLAGVPDLPFILECLAAGPIQMFDRQTMPDSVERVVIDDLYAAIRPGVTIQEQLQEKLFKLFVEESSSVEEITALEVLTTLTGGRQAESVLLQPSQVKPPLKFTRLIGACLVGAIALSILTPFYFRPTPTTSPSAITASQTLTGHTDSVWSVILSPDSKTLISGSADHTIKIWNPETGKVVQTLVGHTDAVRSLTSNGKTLISGSGDRTIKIWNLETNQLLQTLDQGSPVWSVAMSQDGQTLISGSEDGTLKIWHLPTGKLLQSIQAHPNRVFSVALSPDGTASPSELRGALIATAGLDQTIKIWHLATGQLLRTITGHTAAVRTLAFSPDGAHLVSGSWDTTLKLWNCQTGDLIRTFTGHLSRVVTVAFSPDGQTLVSGSTDNTIRVWSVQTRQSLRTVLGHRDWVLAIALNSTLLVSGSKDQTLRIENDAIAPHKLGFQR